MSIITEDWLLGSMEVFLSFLPLSSFSSPLPVGQSAILPSLALEEIRSSHSGPDVHPWQLQLPTSVPVMVGGGYGWMIGGGYGWLLLFDMDGGSDSNPGAGSKQ